MDSSRPLHSKTILVVGAGSGIGRAIAKAAAAAGAHVVLAGRRREALQATADQLTTSVRLLTVDITDEDQVKALFTTISRFDHLVSTATQSAAGKATQLERAAVVEAFGAKLLGPLFLVKHGAPRIAGDGSFTFFSGIRATRPVPGGSITSMTNSGLEAFAKAMAVELAPVRVNAISPGTIDSVEFWAKVGSEARDKAYRNAEQLAPARRVGTTDDVAQAAVFAMSNPFVTGTVLAVDGGANLI